MTAYKRIVTKVEELHSPVYFYRPNGDKAVICNSCKTSYPCATINLLQEEAGNVWRDRNNRYGYNRGSIDVARQVKPKLNGICRTGCPTQDHSSYAECLEAANIGIDKTSLRPWLKDSLTNLGLGHSAPFVDINAAYIMTAKKINLRRQLRIKMLDQMPLCERCQKAYATDLHEVKTRARGGSILDESNICVLCRPCHSWITTNPAEAKEQGWLKNSWE